MSSLHFDARIAYDQLKKDIDQINKQISGFANNAKREAQSVDDTFKRLGGVVAGYFSLQFATDFAKQIASVRGEFQALEVAFNTMLGSKAEADKLMAEVIEFAATTPFDVESVARASKSLLAFGTQTEQVIPTLRRLGDVAAALNIPINELVAIYGKAQSTGKLMTEQLNQFAERGIPVVAELQKMFNITGAEVYQMASESKISFELLQQVIANLTGETGKFGGLMEETSKTIKGLTSNLGDAWTQMLNDIGKANEGTIAGAIKAAISLVENYQKVIDILKVIVVSYGTYKAALILSNVALAKHASIGVFDIATKKLQIAATLKAAAAQGTLNKAMLLNPYALAAAGVTALVSALVIWGKQTEKNVGLSEDFRAELDKEKKTIDGLFNSLKSNSTAVEGRRHAIEQINKNYREYLPNLLNEKSSLEEIEAAYKKVSKAVAENISIKGQENALLEVREKTEKAAKNYEETVQRLFNAAKPTPKQAADLGLELNKIKTLYQENVIPDDQLFDRLQKAFGNIANLSSRGLKSYTDAVVATLQISKQRQQEEVTAIANLSITTKRYLELIGFGVDENNKSIIEDVTTVNDLIKKTQDELESARKRLDELRKPGAKGDIAAIEQTQTRIGELEKDLEILTGISKKANEQAIKAENDRLQALEKLKELETELYANTEADKLKIMQDGVEKQTREAKLQLQSTLAGIEQQYRDALQILDETGLSKDSTEYQASLKNITDQLNQQRVIAEQNYSNQIIAINQAEADRIAEIRKQTLDGFLTDQQREVQAVNEKYDRQQKALQDSGQFDLLTQNEEQRQKELQEIRARYALYAIDFEEEIEARKLEILNRGLANQFDVERQRLEKQKKAAQKRIGELQKIATAEANNEIKLLLLYIEELKADLGEIEKGEASFLLNTISAIGQEFANIDGQIGQAINRMASFGQTALGIFDAFGKNGAVNPLLLIQQIPAVIALISSFFKSGDSADAKTEKLEQVLTLINNTLKLQAELLANLSGQNYYLAAKKQADEYAASISRNTTLLTRYLQVTEDGQKVLENLIETPRYGIDEFGNEVVEGVDFFVDRLALSIDQIIEMWGKGLIDLQDADKARLNQILADRAAAVRLLEDTWQKATGTTRDSIADSIIEGFKSGKRSIEDFADTFEDLMRQAILNTIKTQLIQGPITEFIKDFALLAEDGLTQGDIDLAREFFKNLFNSARDVFDAVQDATGFDFLGPDKKQQGLTGAIKGITEETAGLLAGYMYSTREIQQKTYDFVVGLQAQYLSGTFEQAKRAYSLQENQHMTALQQLDMLNQSVTHLAAIEKNTQGIAKLDSIDDRLRDMNNYLKQVV